MLLLLLLWLQLFWCLSPSWDIGGYYSYGWLVAPIAIAFAWRRWGELKDGAGELEVSRARGRWLPGALLIGYLVVMVPLRMVEIGDPTWRPPLWLHALMLAGLSHFLLGWKLGWRRSMFFLPVTIFALTAVPYPWQIEQTLVRRLTGMVIEMTQEVFLLQGIPVESMGEKLVCGDQVVEVTEGCSGIRSLQSLVMAALFFGELLWLSWPKRLLLLGLAAGCALVVNTGRAYTLAQIQFSQGEAAAEAAHDMVGHVAFAVSCLILFGGAKLLTIRKR